MNTAGRILASCSSGNPRESEDSPVSHTSPRTWHSKWHSRLGLGILLLLFFAFARAYNSRSAKGGTGTTVGAFPGNLGVRLGSGYPSSASSVLAIHLHHKGPKAKPRGNHTKKTGVKYNIEAPHHHAMADWDLKSPKVYQDFF